MSTRKGFLVGTSIAGALAPAIALAAGPPQTANTPAKIAPFVFDRAAFEKSISRDAEHRHSYAAVTCDNGRVLDAMANVLNAYETSLGEKPASVISAAVFYHGTSVGLGFNDRVWNELLIPAIPKMPKRVTADLPPLKVGDGNQWLHKPKNGAFDSSIETLASRGAIFLVCNNATTAFAYALAKVLGQPATDVYARLAGGLVPNAVLVPAGVWAVHALQEAHFTYQQVTI
jgi:intracellular sulfur oxidation DsrE/DsrF family protein